MTWPEYCPILALRPVASSSGIEICIDSRKHAIPSVGSAHNGPDCVNSWNPVRTLSSNKRAEIVDERAM